MHGGYKRNQQKATSASLLFDAQTEERELIFEEMEADCETEDDFIASELERGRSDRELYNDLYLEDAFPSPEFELVELNTLPEDSWLNNEESYDYSDKGMGYFRYIMESIKPGDVVLMDVKWVTCKYSLLTATILAGSFSSEFLSEPSQLLGRYAIKLEEQLRLHGIDFLSFSGITKKGWETYHLLTQKAA